MKLQIGGETDIGAMREENEDSFGTLALPDGFLMTVCDGMGGYAGGRIASSTAVDALLAYVREHYQPEKAEEVLVGAIDAANLAVRLKAQADSNLGEMGTTAVAALASGDRYWVAHVGDSRAYRFRQSIFSMHTSDHTVVQQLVDQGRIDALEAANHPSAGILTRCLGQLDEIPIDVSGPHELKEGDRLLLCSDGLSSMLYEDDIARVLTNPDLNNALRDLIRYANEAGGFDNITATGMQVGEWSLSAAHWRIVVDTPEGRALTESEQQAQGAPVEQPEQGMARDTLMLPALTPEEIAQANYRPAETAAAKSLANKILIGVVIAALIAVATVILITRT